MLEAFKMRGKRMRNVQNLPKELTNESIVQNVTPEKEECNNLVR